MWYYGVLLHFVVFHVTSVSEVEYNDDFSNNLFSDLAPILALFGEQVTKQFMAGSTTWEENIIVAMAPLGIITAIVGAVRIAGPLWLRALVGRARENKAVAEVELTTSTSRDVCELWNGSTIVRMMGTPRILQLIFIPSRWTEKDFGLFTLIDGSQSQQATFTPKPKYSFDSFFGTSRKQSPQDEEDMPRRQQILENAPNISLNLQPPRSSKQEWELRFWTVFAILLQAGVLLFCAFATYYVRMSYLKDGLPVEDYAYPLMAGGTVILIIGMTICAYIVEGSTVEETWVLGKGVSGKARIVWLQQGGNVNDQYFDSHAIFAGGERGSIITSGLTTSALRDDDHDRSGQELAGSGDHPNTALVPASDSKKTLVIVGTLLSVGGFIIQFTGLRGMHWSASVAQLIATLIMVGVRAWIRRELGSQPSTSKMPHGYEIDWLAISIARNQEGLWGSPGRNTGDDHTTPSQCKHKDYLSWQWRIKTGHGTENFQMKLSTGANSDPNGPRTGAQSVLKVRERIGYLSGWTGVASQPAIAVANAIEVVMNSLFADVKAGTIMTWTMDVQTSCNETEAITLSVKREEEGGSWTASATELEALLSLWLYSIHANELKENAYQDPRRQGEGDNLRKSKHNDWLRHGNTALANPALRLLGKTTERYIQDLRWYLGPVMDALLSVEELETREICPGQNISRKFRVQKVAAQDSKGVAAPNSENEVPAEPKYQEIDHFRVFGFRQLPDRPQPTPPKPTAQQPTAPHETQQSRGDNLDTSPLTTQAGADEEKHSLGVVFDAPLERLFAQDVFSTFMWGISNSREMKPITGETTIQASSNQSWKVFKLENTVLSTLIKDVERAVGQSLGTLQDIYLSILPPLCLRGKMPTPFCILSYALQLASKHEAVNHWQEAADVYSWLLHIFKDLSEESSLKVKTAAAFSEFNKAIGKAIEALKNEREDPTEDRNIQSLEKLRAELESNTGDITLILKHLETLSRLQSGSDGATENFLGFPNAGENHQLVFQNPYWGLVPNAAQVNERDLLQLTPLHYAVITEDLSSITALITFGAVTHSQDSTGWTPLHYAVALGLENLIKVLLWEETVAIHSKDINGRTPLMYAHTEKIAWILLQKGAEVDHQGRDGSAALHNAAKHGLVVVATLLIEAGATVDILDNHRRTPLHWAAYLGDEKMAQVLVGKGANLAARDHSGRIPLHLAAWGGLLRKPMLDILQGPSYMAATDRSGLTPLHLASGARGDMKDAAFVLVEHATDINVKGRLWGRTPLHLAASEGSKSTARMLINEGKANVEAEDNFGQTPLHYAATKNSEAVARLLIVEAGANVEAEDQFGNTPLHDAASKNSEAVARLLIVEGGANVEAQDRYGNTPLHVAVSGNFAAFARLLIVEAGANVEAKNKAGNTPLDFATTFRNFEAIAHLLKAKARGNSK